ncbi:MAG TPA: NAD(+)/NADH kinase [Acidimicrobiales bacterium]|nr:NAD(+)/NADH kinase [Acidimicrobiales bacterium]
MATVALVLNTGRRRAVELAHQAADWLTAHDHEVRVPEEDASASGLAKYGCPPDEVGPGADVAVSLGGDGTILRTVSLVACHEVPVLGVNVGRLGYLAHVEPDALIEAMARVVAGDVVLEERLLLCVRVTAAPGSPAADEGLQPEPLLALNEAVVEKASAGQVVHVGVHVDDEFFTSYAADGLIVATPTGSTAYAFSARGPIIAPQHRALLLTPVSPHMAFDRSLVFAPAQVLRLEVLDRPARFIVDGRELGPLAPGSTITCTAAEEVARFVSLGPWHFYRVLKSKFGLADR